MPPKNLRPLKKSLPGSLQSPWKIKTKHDQSSGAASQIDIGRIEGQRVYHNNKPLTEDIENIFWILIKLTPIDISLEQHRKKNSEIFVCGKNFLKIVENLEKISDRKCEKNFKKIVKTLWNKLQKLFTICSTMFSRFFWNFSHNFFTVFSTIFIHNFSELFP